MCIVYSIATFGIRVEHNLGRMSKNESIIGKIRESHNRQSYEHNPPMPSEYSRATRARHARAVKLLVSGTVPYHQFSGQPRQSTHPAFISLTPSSPARLCRVCSSDLRFSGRRSHTGSPSLAGSLVKCPSLFLLPLLLLDFFFGVL